MVRASDETGANHRVSGTTQSSAAPYWTDPETQLMWTTSDNGVGTSWSQAARYCRDLNAGGFKDWKLPNISDLQRLFGGQKDAQGYSVRGPIKLTGWQWSATAGARPGEGWTLDFGDGARASVAAGDSGLNRALCVRNPSTDGRARLE
jgi:hypothetical protein